MDNWHQSQRGFFAGALLQEMEKDDTIYLLVGDLGFGVWDRIQERFPKRVINCYASEQAMLGVAVGLALEGKKPFVYTITSFFLRGAETLHLYLQHEEIPVRLVGAGRDNDYKDDGFSHFAFEAQNFIKGLTEIVEYYPESKEEVPEMVRKMVSINSPSFISLKR